MLWWKRTENLLSPVYRLFSWQAQSRPANLQYPSSYSLLPTLLLGTIPLPQHPFLLPGVTWQRGQSGRRQRRLPYAFSSPAAPCPPDYELVAYSEFANTSILYHMLLLTLTCACFTHANFITLRVSVRSAWHVNIVKETWKLNNGQKRRFSDGLP